MNKPVLSFSRPRQPQPASLLLSNDLHDALAAQAALVFEKLRERFAGSMSDAEIALVFVHYLYGTVTAALPDAEPGEWLGALRDLAGRFLGADDLTCALHAAPPDAATPVGCALKGAEPFGRRDAEAILVSLGRAPPGDRIPEFFNQPSRPAR